MKLLLERQNIILNYFINLPIRLLYGMLADQLCCLTIIFVVSNFNVFEHFCGVATRCSLKDALMLFYSYLSTDPYLLCSMISICFDEIAIGKALILSLFVS